MRSKISLLLLISFCLLLFSGQVFGAGEKFLVVAPGQTWSSGTGLAGIPVSQVAGVPFNVSIVAVDAAGTAAYDSSGASVTMTCNAISSITPANTFQLQQSLGAIPNSLRYPVTVTFDQSVTGPVVIAANSSGVGPSFGSVTISSQIIGHFHFNSIVVTPTAGTAFMVTITAHTAAEGVVSGFNGTAALSANYPVTGSVSLGNIQFVNGVYNGLVTLYDASEAAVTLVCTSTVPAVATSQNGGLSKINAAAISKLVIIGPGQTFAPGTNGGNGRSGGSTAVSQQTAGSYFYVTVYAVDAYYNTSSTSSNITISSTDTNAVFTTASGDTSGSPNFGRVIFKVELRTVGAGTQTLTAAGTGVAGGPYTDTVPIIFGAVDHFNVTKSIASTKAGVIFTVTAAAVDLYNNTVTTYTTPPAVSFYSGTTLLNTGHTYNTTATFSGGLSSFYAKVYQKASGVTVKLTSTVTGSSNAFDVSASDFSKLLFVAPGQQPDPGDNNNGGVMYSPDVAIASTPTTVDVYATDDYGNKIGTINDTISLTTSDAAASIAGITPPANISLISGQGSFTIIFRTTGTRTVTGTDTTTTGITDATVSIVVQASVLSYFEVANVPGTVISGQSFAPVVRAKDQYGNTIANFTGLVYLTSNTDYTGPNESTMAITSGSGVGPYYNAWALTITAGERTDLTGYLYRATTYTAKIFVSDNFNDTPISHSGHFGLSSPCTVNYGNAVKLQVLPPGVEARPGTLDGENNTPSGQALSVAFSVTVNLTDVWWNIVPGRADEIRVSTTDPPNSSINSAVPASAPNGVSVFLVNGTANFSAAYSSQSSSFQVVANDYAYPSMINDFSQNISIYQINSFSIRAVGGINPIGNQTVGLPFSVQITAFSAFGVTATGFNSTMEISANTDYNASEYTISPTRTISFTSGIAVMPITMYRARTSATDGSGAVIYVRYGSQLGQSDTFDLTWGPATSCLVLADGMTHKPGLKQVGIPGYKGYDGSPKTVEAGFGSTLRVLYVDDNYNRVYSSNTFCKLTSSDPAASIYGISMAANNVYVTITAGELDPTTSAMVLRTVGVTGQQYITAEPGGSIPNNTTPPINIRHTTFNHFTVVAPGGPITAGVPFKITIQALDVYSNVCDDMNGGASYDIPASLSCANLADGLNTGAKNMYPMTSDPLSKGVVYQSVQLFEAPGSTSITAGSGSSAGVSNIINTVSGAFEKLFIMVLGMKRKNGIYTGSSPSAPGAFTMYDTTLPPFAPSNNAVVNDAAHTPAGYPFTIYACDKYGNITYNTPDVIGQTVTVTTNDPYAIPVTVTAIDSVSGQVIVNMIFHKAAPGTVVSASITAPLVSSFTTPVFETLAGTPYGIQLIVPGLSVDNGSGYYDGTYWHSGVTGSTDTQYSGLAFKVTAQASDIYGNFTNSLTDTIRVTSTAPDPSFPSSTNSFTGTLTMPDTGTSTFTARMIVGSLQYIAMMVSDVTDPLKSLHNINTNITVRPGGTPQYRVFVSPNATGPWTTFNNSNELSNSINAVAAPASFYYKVWVMDSVSEQPMLENSNHFKCTAVGVPDSNVELGGTLGVTEGQTTDGIYPATAQSYTEAATFRIKVTDLNTGVDSVPTEMSAKIIMKANPDPAYATFTVTAQSHYIKANNTTNIIGHIADINGNPVSGAGVSFTVTSGDGGFSGLNAAGTSDTKTLSVLTDSLGNATATFYGAYKNQQCIIRGDYFNLSGTAAVSVSFVEPVLGQVSNYPNPFNPNIEPTNISYLLDTAADVKIRIYTLFGDTVYGKDIPSGQPGAEGATVNNFVWNGKNNTGEIVGNGGYICVIETTISGSKKKMIRKIAVSK